MKEENNEERKKELAKVRAKKQRERQKKKKQEGRRSACYERLREWESTIPQDNRCTKLLSEAQNQNCGMWFGEYDIALASNAMVITLHVLYLVLQRDHLMTMSMDMDNERVRGCRGYWESSRQYATWTGFIFYCSYGYMLLEAFIQLHPDLRQNRTGEIIGKLVGPKVYIVYYSLSFHFSSAISMLDVLLRN